MGKASRTKQQPDRRARIAAQRDAERRREQRKRIYLAGGSILVVAIIAIAFVIFRNNGGTAAASSNGPTGAPLATVINEVTGVPTSVTDKIAGGGIATSQFIPQSGISAASSSIGSYFATVKGAPLTQNGKPEILYLGAEYCPFCAAERWSMINALSRFGVFTALTTTHSSSSDAYPNTPTLTFYGSNYTSKYIAFTPVEETRNYRVGNSASTSAPYVTLQNPTSAQTLLGETYDASGSIPFIDLANRYVEVQPPAVRTPAPCGQDLGPGGGGHVAAGLADRADRDRQRELPDRRDLRDHRQPAGDRVHADHQGA